MNGLTIKLCYFIFSLYLMGMAYFLWTNQFYNTDIEAYMGLVYKTAHPEMPIEEIHKRVFQELDQNQFKHSKTDHTGRVEVTIGENTYYKTIAEYPDIFLEELQLFAVKPFYNFINYGFFKLGLSAAASTFAISVISYVLILVVILLFLVRILRNHYLAILFTLFFSLFKPLLDGARHAAPDNLSCLLLLLSFYFFVIKRDLWAVTIFAMLCVFTRPDYIILYTLLTVLLLVSAKQWQVSRPKLLASYFYVAASFLVVQYFNQVPWTILFMNQFVEVQLYPVSNPGILQLADYLRVLKSKIFFEFNSSYYPILLMFIVLIMAGRFSEMTHKQFLFLVSFFAIIYASVFIRFLIFPMLVTRMMIGYYIIIILSLICINFSKVNLSRT